MIKSGGASRYADGSTRLSLVDFVFYCVLVVHHHWVVSFVTYERLIVGNASGAVVGRYLADARREQSCKSLVTS